ncbi:TOMM precursor leader peptide-binding protein [Paenibacillus jiagnxiensis]|uniref:TOMM precursor leader peptide-binding protein n=1 Tax=Paenibacillus jiagnxiensis TaxID=3228926 RepID=UPI0033BFA5D5
MNEQHTRNKILIIGDGKLAELVHDQLKECYSVIRQSQMPMDTQDVKLMFILQDDWDPELLHQTEEQTRQLGIAWITGYITEQEGVIGPLNRPGIPGCSLCAEYRLLNAGREREEILNSQLSLLLHGKIVREEPLQDREIRPMACFISEEADRYMTGRSSGLEGQLYLMNMKTMEINTHRFLPDPTCPSCGQLPDDSPQLAAPVFGASQKAGSHTYRCISEAELERDLLTTYFDERTGVLNQKMRIPASIFAEVAMKAPSPSGDEIVGGKSLSFKSSEMVAVLEGLERLCGTSPRGKKTSVLASYRELGENAITPAAVGTYSQEQYSMPDFPYQPFDPDLPVPWVWGYSFLNKKPILVPEQLAYYSGTAGFVHEFSNGCALGGSMAEAIFHGILEIVERDSFLMTWYAQLPLPLLELSESQDSMLQLMMERMRHVAGYDVFFYNSTMEHGIPSVWAVAKNRKQEGPNLICSAGAHVDIHRAIKSALFELAGAVPRLESDYKNQQDAILDMFNDPYQVQYMEDHALLYCLPQTEERLSFLLENKGKKSSVAQFPSLTPYANMVDELYALMEKFLDIDLDIIVVDQTSPEISVKGLYCVKVLIPGMLPMAFGYHLTRLEGLERVLRVPAELGYTTKRLTSEELNKHPHPFL